MQPQNQDDCVQLSSRYLQYCFAKQCVRGECPREILPLGESGEHAEKTRCDEKCFTAIDANYYKGVGVRGNKCRACVAVSKTIRTGGRGSPHGSKQNWDSYEVGGKIRRLTPRECERLQAFPDNWTKFGNYDGEIKEVSDIQRYKVCGNAITVKVAQKIFEQMFSC